MVEVRFRVPAGWRDALAEAAHSQRISLADLLRIVVRGFIREKYSPEQRAHLELD